MKTFRIGGVHPAENKLSAGKAIETLALPKQAVFPLSQHIGAPATAIVKKGDVVNINFPMHSSLRYLPNEPQYIAFMHGPILLGMKTGTESMASLIADDSRFGQYAGGPKQPIDKATISSTMTSPASRRSSLLYQVSRCTSH